MAVPLQAQVGVPTPPPITHPTSDARPATVEETYGPARPQELHQIAYNGESYQRRNVIVRGFLAPMTSGQYFTLSQGGAQLLVIPLEGGSSGDFMTVMGMEVDVTGIVRVLPTSQPTVPCFGQRLPESVCDDPLLPVLPNVRRDWPRVSITMIRVSARGPGGESNGAPRALSDTGIDAAAADGKPVRAVGQFRGANLCRDLPELSRRDADDWVLLTLEGPVWVTGRPPQGRGFRLDPTYRGDVNRWLEVKGRVTAVDGVRFLRAGSVSLSARPPAAEPAPCAP